jgi:hypothetical protein
MVDAEDRFIFLGQAGGGIGDRAGGPLIVLLGGGLVGAGASDDVEGRIGWRALFADKLADPDEGGIADGPVIAEGGGGGEGAVGAGAIGE